MNGHIYRVPIQGHTRELPHPHVVLIELEKECWVIPAFGDDGPEVAGVLAAHERMGIPATDAAVHMDNARFVTYSRGHSGIKAFWLIARAKKLTKAFLANYEKIGVMSDEGLLLLAEAVLRLARSKPDLFSPSLLKKLRKLTSSLRQR